MAGGDAVAADLQGPNLGIQMGWAQARATVEDSDCATAKCSAYTTAALGATNGIQLGWNHRSGGLLVGISADYAHAGIKARINFGFDNGFASAVHYEEAITHFSDVAALRLRAGLVIDDTAIVLAAGPAIARFSSELRYTAGDQDPGNDYYSQRKGNIQGAVLGVSVEHAIADHVICALGMSQYSFKNEQADWYYAGNGSLYDGYITNHVYSLQSVHLSVSWRF